MSLQTIYQVIIRCSGDNREIKDLLLQKIPGINLLAEQVSIIRGRYDPATGNSIVPTQTLQLLEVIRKRFGGALGIEDRDRRIGQRHQ